jgi:large subunit ribosomal protein L6
MIFDPWYFVHGTQYMCETPWIHKDVSMTPMTPHRSTLHAPEGVTIHHQHHYVLFRGPLGVSSINLHALDPTGVCGIRVLDGPARIDIVSMSKSRHGLLTQLFLNKMVGVTRGYVISLKMSGIGYRATLHHNTLSLKCGYSHDILYRIPESIHVFLVDPTLICVFGIDKNELTQVAASLRALRPPSPYKGKGIRLVHESVVLKPGKRK